MMGAIVIGLTIGIALCIPFVWWAQEGGDRQAEELRKLRLDLHKDGWNPDRIGKGPLVNPTESDFQIVINSTQDNLRDRGLRPKAGMFDADTAEQMREAFANDPRFQFTRDADGNLMVGLNEDYKA
jgi:hypothetical protein